MVQNIILIASIVLILGAAGLYIYRKKKKGVTCIGCPYAKECMSKKSTDNCSCGCNGGEK